MCITFFYTWGNPHGHLPPPAAWKRRDNVGLYRLKPHGGPPNAQLECTGPKNFRITAGALLRVLLSEGVVPWLVRTLGGTTPLYAIPWAVVQV